MDRTRGVVIASIAGVLLATSALVSAQSSTTASPSAPVAITATTAGGPCAGATTETITQDGLEITRERGLVCHPDWLWTDPRLNGAVSLASSTDILRPGDVTVGVIRYLIENDGGSWRSDPIWFVSGPASEDRAPTGTWVWRGEGGYAGLTAVAFVSDWTPHGYIFQGDLPPIPGAADGQPSEWWSSGGRSM